VALQHAHVFSILKHVVAIGEVSSKLDILLGGPPLSLFDMFFMKGRGSGI
jgi:hypothetical protein